MSPSHAEIVSSLTRRWPENRVAPSLGRIRALVELLGDPQTAYPVIHITGTNGKGSTAAMIEALLRVSGLRTGRFSSPHITTVNERIAIDGDPISDERFDEIWHDIEPYVAMVDARAIDGVAMTFFEIITGMAFAAFADAPVDVAVIEVGLGGTWDATNVADGSVAVVTPIDLDHTHLLGTTIAAIATEKAGIIKPGAQAILAGQPLEAAQVLLARCAEVGALVHREGIEFGVLDRSIAVGGQLIRLNGAEGPIDEIFLPLHGAHQAANAAQALAAVEAFMGLKALNPDLVREGFATVTSPGRLELVRRSPAVVLDAAHNPHGARAAAEGVVEAFSLTPLIGVIAVMGDKDADGLLRAYEEVLNSVVITQVASTARGMPAEELGELAESVFGTDRVRVVPRLDDALETAIGLAEGEGIGSPGVLVTGSVVAVGEARTLLLGDQPALTAAVGIGQREGTYDADDDYVESDDESEDGFGGDFEGAWDERAADSYDARDDEDGQDHLAGIDRIGGQPVRHDDDAPPRDDDELIGGEGMEWR